MGRLENAWRLAKASWQVLSRDRELLAIPILAGIASVLAFLAILGPGVVLVGNTDWAVGLIAVLALVVATWIAALGQATVVAGAAQRMEGGDPTVGSAFAQARSRTGRLLEWSILATVVSIILDQIEERFGALGNVVAWLGGIAFSVLSFLALPVIVFENVGAIEAFKRSSRLLKGTWGEQVSFTFGMGLLGFVLMLPALLVGGGLVATGVVPLQVVGIVAAVAWVAAVWAVTSALSAVFKTALYRYATGRPVDAVFAPSDLSGAFRPR